MPALPVVPGVLKAIVKQTFTELAAPIITRLFLQPPARPTTTQLAALSNSIANQWVTNIAPIQSNTLDQVEVDLYDLSDYVTPVETATVVATGGIAAALPVGDAFIIQHHIARRYRGGHARTYLYAGDRGWVTNYRYWGATQAATMLGDWVGFIAAINDGMGHGVQQVNVSYFSGFTNHLYPSGRYRAIPTPRVNPVVDQIVVQAYNPKIGSQRRRYEQSA